MYQPQPSKDPAPDKVKGKGVGPVHIDGKCWPFINVGRREEGPLQQARTQFAPTCSPSPRYFPVAFNLCTLITPNPLTMNLYLTPLPAGEIKKILQDLVTLF